MQAHIHTMASKLISASLCRIRSKLKNLFKMKAEDSFCGQCEGLLSVHFLSSYIAMFLLLCLILLLSLIKKHYELFTNLTASVDLVDSSFSIYTHTNLSILDICLCHSLYLYFMFEIKRIFFRQSFFSLSLHLEK